jgi:hypothetical protein
MTCRVFFQSGSVKDPVDQRLGVEVLEGLGKLDGEGVWARDRI